MKPDIYNFIATLAADYGVDAAAEVAAFEAKHVHAMKDFIESEKIDCDYTVTKAVDVQLTESHFKKLKDGYNHLVSSGSQATAQAQIIEFKDAEAVCLLFIHKIPEFRRSTADIDPVFWSKRCCGLLYVRRGSHLGLQIRSPYPGKRSLARRQSTNTYPSDESLRVSPFYFSISLDSGDITRRGHSQGDRIRDERIYLNSGPSISRQDSTCTRNLQSYCCSTWLSSSSLNIHVHTATK